MQKVWRFTHDRRNHSCKKSKRKRQEDSLSLEMLEQPLPLGTNHDSHLQTHLQMPKTQTETLTKPNNLRNLRWQNHTRMKRLPYGMPQTLRLQHPKNVDFRPTHPNRMRTRTRNQQTKQTIQKSNSAESLRKRV